MLFVLFILGLSILIYSSHYILRGASNFARLIHISEYAIGITIVAVSTSLPEFFVSVDASLKGLGIISLANVVGSNIFNIILIFMVLSIFSKQLFNLNKKFIVILLSLQMSMLLLSAMQVKTIPRIVGLFYLLALIGYFYWELRLPQKHKILAACNVALVEYTAENMAGSIEMDGLGVSELEVTMQESTEDLAELDKNSVPAQHSMENTRVRKGLKEKIQLFFAHAITRGFCYLMLVLLGSAMLYLGTEVFVNSISTIGSKVGIPDLVIGVVFVALGTSLPELMVTVIALVQIAKLNNSAGNAGDGTGTGLQNMAEGNIIGSCIINILGVLGFTVVVQPLAGISLLLTDIILMNLAGLILLAFVVQKKWVQKSASLLLLLCFLFYLLYMYRSV